MSDAWDGGWCLTTCKSATEVQSWECLGSLNFGYILLRKYVSILPKQHPNWTFVYKGKKKAKEGYGVGGYGK